MRDSSLLRGLIETALNGALALDADSPARLARLKGRTLALTLQEVGQTWYLVFGADRVRVLGQWQTPPDCQLTASVWVLGQLQDGSQLTRLIQQQQLEIDGDLQIARQVAALFGEWRLEPEALLVPWLGEAGAHLLVAHAEQGRRGLIQVAERMRRQLAELVTEEHRLAPGPLEVAAFCDEVDRLKGDADRFQQRLRQVEAALDSGVGE